MSCPSRSTLERQLIRSYSMASHPESFPVNTLVPIEGTPLEKNDVSQQKLDLHMEYTADVYYFSPFRSRSFCEQLQLPESSCPNPSSDLLLADTPFPKPSKPW